MFRQRRLRPRFRRSSSRQSKASEMRHENAFQLRLVIMFALIVLCFLVLLMRFVWLQIVQHEHFLTLAQNNRISLVPIPPNRGIIYDRNGIILAQNYSAYTLEISPRQIKNKKLDEVIDELAQIVNIEARDRKRFRKLREESRNFESLPIRIRLSDEEVARFAAQAYRFPGVEIKARLFREYPFKEITSHITGYIGRINQQDLERFEENNQLANYRGSTHTGKTGLEYSYENDLHGKTGFEEVEVDVSGQAVRSLRKVPATNGSDLHLALDIRLQEFVYEKFANRRGALVAIEPETGGVLAFVSAPGFDPSVFIDGLDPQVWKDLNEDWQKPLINRALRGLYPPGSTFKPFMAMAALESGFRDPKYVISDPGYFSLPGSTHRFRDSKPTGHGTVNMFKSIQVSSDTYYYKLAWDMGIDRIAPQLAKFGLGERTGIDLDGEARGVLPTKAWKEKRFSGKNYRPEQRRWLRADVVPIGIGQGYNIYTPLQMAWATAILANDGIAFRPHVTKRVVNHLGTERLIEPQPYADNHFQPQHVAFVKSAMEAVMKPGGTAWRLGQGLQYRMGGKTGTAQVVQIKQGAKYNAAALAEQHRDHSWFIAFAPMEKPKIALAVIVENGGWGAAAAAPLARQALDFYLLGKGEIENSRIPDVARINIPKEFQTPEHVLSTDHPELSAGSDDNQTPNPTSAPQNERQNKTTLENHSATPQKPELPADKNDHERSAP